MPHLYIAAPVWASDEDGEGWFPPSEHVVGMIDLRSRPERTDPQSTSVRCLWALSQPDALDGYLGEYGDKAALDQPLDPTVIRLVEERLGLPAGSIEATTMADVIGEVLTVHADPTGEDRWKPLLSDTIFLGGFSPIWQNPWIDPRWQANILALLRIDFARIRQDGEDGRLRGPGGVDRDKHRRVLGGLDAKWRPRCGITAADIDPGVEPLPPETTITESFDKADGAGLGPDLTWGFENTILADPAWETISNEATEESGRDDDPAARAEHDLSTDDHYSEAPMYGETDDSAASGTAVRFQADAYTCYRGGVHVNADDVRLFIFEDGGKTLLDSVAFTASAGTVYTVRTEASDSTIRVLVGGTEELSVTNTTITGNLRCGIGYYTSGTGTDRRWFFQSFEAADLAGGQTVAIGLATETDTAQPVAAAKTQAIAQAQETDAAQPATAVKARTLGQATETDTAQAVVSAKAAAIAQAVETDAAQPVTRAGQTAAITQATEADTAQPVTHAKAATLSQAQETDTAQPVTAVEAHQISQAVETDSAQAVTHSKAQTIGQAVETDSAQSVAVTKRLAIGLATETDLAQAVTAVKARLLGQAVDTSTAQAVTWAKTFPIGQAVETDTAQRLPQATVVAIGQAVETDTAHGVTVRLAVTGTGTRVLYVTADNRTFHVDAEVRTTVVGPDNRTLVVAAGDRSQLVS